MRLTLPQEFVDLIRPTRRRLAQLVVLGVLLAGLEATALAMFYGLGSAVFGRPLPGPLAGLLTALGALRPAGAIGTLGALLVAALVLKFVVFLRYEGGIAGWRARVLTDLQNEVMANYLGASIRLYFERRQGDLLNGVYTLPFKATEGLMVLPKLVSSAAMVLAIGGLLFALSPGVFLAAAALAAIFGAGVAYCSRRIIVPSNRGRVEAQRVQAEIAAETTAGVKEIRVLGAERLWAARFAEQVRAFNRLWLREHMATVTPNRLMELGVQTAFALWVVASVHLVSAERLMSALPLIATYAYGFMRIYPSLTELGQGVMRLAANMPHVRAVAVWRALEPDPLGAPGMPPPPVGRGIEFREVGFAYSPGREAVSRASFTIPAGAATALVGTSGSGKSTVVDLLLKLIEPSEGRIVVDGVDLATVDRRAWLERIGIVDQEIFLFHGTIAENVRMARPDATTAEVLEACRLAGLEGFLAGLPRGLETVVGDRGVTLSGGERQRLAIARALVRDPAILLFDEATSSLDRETEARVLETIWRLKSGRTLLIVAHRWSAVAQADHVIVLSDGRCVEEGTVDALLDARGALWAMARDQGLAGPVRVSG